MHPPLGTFPRRRRTSLATGDRRSHGLTSCRRLRASLQEVRADYMRHLARPYSSHAGQDQYHRHHRSRGRERSCSSNFKVDHVAVLTYSGPAHGSFSLGRWVGPPNASVDQDDASIRQLSASSMHPEAEVSAILFLVDKPMLKLVALTGTTGMP